MSWNSSYFLAYCAPQCEFGLVSFLPHGWLLPCPSGSPQHPELPVLMGTRSAPANPGDWASGAKSILPSPLMLFGLQQDAAMGTGMGRCNSSHHPCVTDQNAPSLHRASPAYSPGAISCQTTVNYPHCAKGAKVPVSLSSSWTHCPAARTTRASFRPQLSIFQFKSWKVGVHLWARCRSASSRQGGSKQHHPGTQGAPHSSLRQTSHAQAREQQSSFSLLNAEVGEDVHEPWVEEVSGTKPHHCSPQSNTLTIRHKAADC